LQYKHLIASIPERNLTDHREGGGVENLRNCITKPDSNAMRTATCSIFLSVALAVAYGAAASPTPAANMRSVDLRSFFHGDPPAPPKAPPPKRLATVSSASDIVADPQTENFIRAFAEAVMARDGKPLLARLSDKYVIDDLPEGMKAADMFLQAIDTVLGATDIIIKSVDRKNDMRIAKVEFKFSANNIKLKTFRFDAAGKLLWSDLFVLKRQIPGA
jgi:hypothetical protein